MERDREPPGDGGRTAPAGITQGSITKNWQRGPDPRLVPVPKGKRAAAKVWHARKAILDLEERIARLGEERSKRMKTERTALDEWERRERAKVELEGVEAMRDVGLGGEAIR